MDERLQRKPIKPISNCEHCEFYDYDEEYEEYHCTMRLDEDEMADFIARRTQNCPYFRFYDEYKSVHKQI